MTDRLVILGSKGGPAIRPAGPSPSSSLLELGGRRAVVDCGLGVTRGLTHAGIDLKSLDLIFITHLHSDHVLELGPLLHTAWTAGLSNVVRIFGPRGLNQYWQHFLQSMDFDIKIRIADEGRPDLCDLAVVREFDEGVVFDEAGFAVTALRVAHPPVDDCFALRFDSAAKSVVFSSDTAFFPPLAEFARDADILVHEAMHEAGVDRLVARTGNGSRLREHLMASHTLAPDVGRIASMAKTRLLVLNHLVPADDPQVTEADWIEAVRKSWSGALTIGRDGLVVPLAGSKPAHGRNA